MDKILFSRVLKMKNEKIYYINEFKNDFFKEFEDKFFLIMNRRRK
jgi:hypothetical protein